QALRGGECDLALAGGVTVLWTPGVFVEFSRQRGLASDGRCKSYADAADGTGWAEGVGVLVLERLSQAQRNGHQILGVVSGSAVNQDGASNGLTSPNGPSQERVIAQALANAGLSPAEIDAVEGHGTGTTLGDPIEAQALLATYGQGRPADRPLWLGSVKSNIGHTQAAAGVAGVIKMVLALRNGLLPRTLHVDRPSSHVEWEEGGVVLLTEPRTWAANGRPRRAGVSSFGISGTNAHVIVEEAPRIESPTTAGDSFVGDALPWVLSGRGRGALEAQAARLGEFLAVQLELDAADVALSLASRPQLEDRAVLVGEREELLAGLAALACAEPAANVVRAGRATGEQGRIALLFPGQGGQWDGMAVELLNASPLFARRLAECADALEPFVGWRLEDVLRGVPGAPELGRVDVVQPALWAVMVSLAELWRACGVRPDVVVGHSQGEIAAACVAGGLTLEDAARVVALRSRALVSLAGKGGMVSVALGAEQLRPRLEPFGERVALAAANGPGSAVVSGDPEALDRLLEECEAEGVRARRIAVDYAAHSVQIEQVREELLEGCAGIAPRSGEIPFHSTVTGGILDTAELDAEYWYRNLRETVRFEQATRALLEEGVGTFIESSPHQVLALAVQEAIDLARSGGPTADGPVTDAVSGATVQGSVNGDTAQGSTKGAITGAPTRAQAATVGSLRRDDGGPRRFLTSLAEAWVHGAKVDWGPLLAHADAERVTLPPYAFRREHYWLAPGGGAGDVAAAGLGAAGHPLLGAAIGMAAGEGCLFTGRLSLATHPWLADHAVLGAAVLPGAALVELALHAGAQVGCETVRELVLEAPLVVREGERVQLQLTVGEPDDAVPPTRPVAIHTRVEGDDELVGAAWTRHASGVLATGGGAGADASAGTAADELSGGEWPPAGAEAVELNGIYERLASAGLEYGPLFQGLQNMWRQGNELFAELELNDDQAQATRYGLHPALFDAALHPAAVAALLDADGEGACGENAPGENTSGEGATGPGLPFAWSGVSLYATGATRLRVYLSRSESDKLSLRIADGSGGPVAAVESLVVRPISPEQFARAQGGRDSLYYLKWAPIDAIERGAGATETVFVDCAHEDDPDDLAAAVRLVSHRVLEQIQSWLAEDRKGSRLAFVTRGAVAVSEGEALPGLAQAAVSGLVRTAQTESPGQFMLIDVDGEESSQAALAKAPDEPQVAVREGRIHVPRLAPATPRAAAGAADPTSAQAAWLDPDRTVLITGGGELGALMARHLVEAHGARSIVLASRRGPAAEGAEELVAQLRELGAETRIVACDVTDRAQVQATLDAVPAEHPLGAVVHTAGVLDDGVVNGLTLERLDRVLAPKVDGALHLHELTAQMELTAFVLFSSFSALSGGAGQGNYAAANAFLDGLAAARRAQGLAGVSLAWGLWEQAGGLTSELGEVDRARIARAGIRALTEAQGLGLFDAAQQSDHALLAPVSLDRGMLRAQAKAGTLPALLHGLVRVPARRAAAAKRRSLVERLAGVPAAGRGRVVLQLTLAQVATVLGYPSAAAIDPRQPLKELGFDSLAAVELRNRLSAETALALPATLVFDHPSAEAIARHLLDEVGVEMPSPPPVEVASNEDEDIKSASADEVLALLERELGSE
ncbi:MAG: type I polyketide synthase, partial [Solirubrobacteraceae bacterium]